MQKIRFVYFDVGQVLVSMKEGFADFCTELKLTDVEIENFDRTWSRYSNRLCRGEISSGQMVEKFRDEAGVKLSKWFDVIDMTIDRFEPIPQMQELVVDVSMRYSVGLLSNAYKGMLDGLMKQSKLPKVKYSAVMDSFVEKMVKPDPEFYKLATQRAGVKADEILFVDDSWRNLDAAKQMSWQVFLFDENQTKRDVERLRKMLL